MFTHAGSDGYIPAVEGITRKTLVHAARTLMTEFRLEAGAVLPRHAHPYEQMRQAREQIRALVTSGSYDEAKVRELAQKASSAGVELMVIKARTHSQIYALLTPEQQQKAGKLAPLFEERRGHYGRHGGGRWR